MSTKSKDVKGYIAELDRSKEGRTDQVREGLEIYIGLWRRALERKVVSESDSVDDALSKIERRGGLYRAAGD